MSEKHDIETYSKLALGASFFLEESFMYLHRSLKNDFASILFSQSLDNLEPSEEDMNLFDKFELPDTHIGILQSEMPDMISNTTSEKMAKAWEQSRKKSETTKHKFKLDHQIESIEILGHLNNFGFFIETIINRHLLFLNQTGVINDFSYSRISISKIMERIIYIFKEELNSNKIQLNEIQNLFRLRNKTVHFTPDNAKVLKPRISELIKIWEQCRKLIDELEKKENFNEHNFSEQIQYYANGIRHKWY